MQEFNHKFTNSKWLKNLTNVNAARVGIRLRLLTALTVAVAADLLANREMNFVANISV